MSRQIVQTQISVFGRQDFFKDDGVSLNNYQLLLEDSLVFEPGIIYLSRFNNGEVPVYVTQSEPSFKAERFISLNKVFTQLY